MEARLAWAGLSGDLPTDYISSTDVEPPQHPRKALGVIAELWRRCTAAWLEGREVAGIHVAGVESHRELAPLLAARAALLIKWVNTDELWQDQ